MDYTSRINFFRAKLSEKGADAAIISSPANILYFSGFTGGSDGTVLITKDRQIIFTDTRYTLQAKAECPSYELMPSGKPMYGSIASALENAKNVAFEDNYLSVSAYNRFIEKVPGKDWLPLGDTLLRQRQEKSLKEIALISESVRLADSAFSYVIEKIKAGMTEREVASLIESYMRREGASRTSFETVCASGIRSALPHGAASDKILEEGDFLTLDFGCLLDGYCSDMTRTIAIGKATDLQKEIYNIVLYAGARAEKSINTNMKASELDAVARNIIDSYGYGKNFGHALGHGVGIEIHELPSVSPVSSDIISPGSVITIEPGIYIEDFGGVRIEDMIFIEKNMMAILTKSTKELIEI